VVVAVVLTAAATAAAGAASLPAAAEAGAARTAAEGAGWAGEETVLPRVRGGAGASSGAAAAAGAGVVNDGARLLRVVCAAPVLSTPHTHTHACKSTEREKEIGLGREKTVDVAMQTKWVGVNRVATLAYGVDTGAAGACAGPQAARRPQRRNVRVGHRGHVIIHHRVSRDPQQARMHMRQEGVIGLRTWRRKRVCMR
jgi:hypothetical protein